MRTLLLPQRDPDFQFAKAGLLEPLMQLHLAETEPLVGVRLMSSTTTSLAGQPQLSQPVNRIEFRIFVNRFPLPRPSPAPR